MVEQREKMADLGHRSAVLKLALAIVVAIIVVGGFYLYALLASAPNWPP